MTVAPPTAGVPLTVAGDRRITRIGAILRRTKLDELAQLIDVLRGTMSLVGPRPEVPRYVAHYPPEWRARLLSVRPGITDFASVRYRDENELLAQAHDPEREYIDVILPTKLRYALHYVDQPTFANDLKRARADAAHRLRSNASSFNEGLRYERQQTLGLAGSEHVGAAGRAIAPSPTGGGRTHHPGLLAPHLPVSPGLRALAAGPALVRRLRVVRRRPELPGVSGAGRGAARTVALLRLRRLQANRAGLRAGRRDQRRGGADGAAQRRGARGVVAAPACSAC